MTPREYNCYLYRHIRLDTNQPFYIGVGIKKEHFSSHKTEYRRAFEYKYNRTKYWKNIISSTEYEVEILMESNDYKFILQKEAEFIKLYGRQDLGLGPLVNLNDGGGGSLGHKWTLEQKEIRSLLIKNQFKNGIRNNKSLYTEVHQYDLNGKYIKSFDYIHSAELELGVTKGAIGKAALGKQNTSNGFMWSLIKLDFLKTPKRRKNTKAVLQYSKEGIFIKEWVDLYDIKKILGFKREPINNNLINKSKSSYGFIWKYK